MNITLFHLSKYRKLLNYIILVISAFFLLNIKWTGTFTFILSEFLFCAYILTILFILRSNLLLYVFEPPVIFLAFLLLYELLKFPAYFNYKEPKVFVDSQYLYNSVYPVDDYYSSFAYMLFFQFICIGVLLITYKYSCKSRFTNKKIDLSFKNDNILLYTALVCLIFSFVGFMQITNGNFLYLLSRRSGNSEAWDVLKSNYSISLSCNVVLAFMPILLSLRVYTNRHWKLLVVIYVCAILLSYLITGARGFTVYSIISTAILLTSRAKISIIKLTLLGIFIMFLFSSLGVLRRSMGDTNNVIANIKDRTDVEGEWYYEISNYQLQLRDEMMYANVDKAGYLLGSSYLNLVCFAIPRSILGELKPNFLDYTVAMTFWRRDDVGLPLNAISESYFNFGALGIIIFILFGRAMAFVTNTIVKNPSILLISTTITLCLFAQSGSTTYLVYAIQFLMILMAPIYLINKFKPKSRYPKMITT